MTQPPTAEAGPRRRFLVVNVNTTRTMTESIGAAARAVAGPDTEVEALTPFFGPAAVEGNFESQLSAVAVCDRVQRYEGPYDGVLLAGYGEHGREALQELCTVPVVDITEAAAQTAMLLGRSYAVVTTLDRAVPMIHDRLLTAGLLERCAAVRAADVPVLDLEERPDAAVVAILEQARRAVTEDRAEVICLGCGGMAGLADRVRAELGVPVVDGVAAGVLLLESLVRQGLSTSKVRTYAPPLAKTITGWPLPRPEPTEHPAEDRP